MRCTRMLPGLLIIGAGMIGNIKMTHAQTDHPAPPTIQLGNEGEVASQGLYLTRAAFGRSINARDNTIRIYKGYIYVSWYKGGFDDRSVWLSRKKIGRGEWQHIQFPHRHVMFRKDQHLPEHEQRGDAHNWISIGICPKDDTIHLLYDLHAYTPSDFKDDYFNYSYSKKGAAIVPDDQWNIDLFHPKQNYLNPDIDRGAYYRVTYPGFRTTDAGNLVVHWRVGGTHDALMHFNEYDGEQWSAPRQWNATGGDKQVGFYGSFTPINGRLYAQWTHRSNALRAAGFPHGGQAVYAAYSNNLNGEGPWFSLAGEKFELPLEDLEPFKMIEARSPKEKARSGAAIVTPTGDVQLTFRAGDRAITATLPEGETDFQITETEGMDTAGGILHGEYLYTIQLDDGTPVIQSTKFGTNDWQECYRFAGERRFSHGAYVVHDGSIFYYLQQVKPRNDDARPLWVLRFDLPKD